MKKLLVIVVFAMLYTDLALSFCYAPTAPSSWNRPTKPIKPSVPFCVNTWDNSHTCDDWTISNYNNDVQSYNSALRSYSYDVDDYIRKLQSYVNDAQEYANCEVRNLD